MKCPQCTETTLVMTERQGIEIDYCPSCRGVWLDRGELDKLIERSAQAMPAHPSAVSQQVQPHYEPVARRPDFVDSDYKHHSGHSGYRKRKSWLGELFD
ncbi:MAG: zf-TFIIB domain-containing protein [Burkholderiaceae bacterium]|nr:zf-TFIIB domain-containing protein [Burkholderiaceae bacterium]